MRACVCVCSVGLPASFRRKCCFRGAKPGAVGVGVVGKRAPVAAPACRLTAESGAAALLCAACSPCEHPARTPCRGRPRLQIRQDLDAAKSRLAESEKRLDVVMDSYVSKAYW